MTKIIGEIGINHSGDFDYLIELADMAMNAGLSGVKLQLRTPELCVPEHQQLKPKQWKDGSIITYLDYKKKIELSSAQLEQFDQYMQSTYGGWRWSASIWDELSLLRLLKFDVPYIKIPSPLLTSHKLIIETIKTGIPVILSTGMSTFKEIDEAVKLFSYDYPLTLLHCNSSYPTDMEEENLSAIKTLRDIYHRPVGYSSHAVSPFVPLAAMWRYDADPIEVHLTTSRALWGSDMPASLERPALELLVREEKRLRQIDGNGAITVYDSELDKRKSLRGY